jgi:hypothetical protein
MHETISAVVDQYSAGIGLLLLVALLAGFVSERLPAVVIAVAGVGAVLASAWHRRRPCSVCSQTRRR